MYVRYVRRVKVRGATLASILAVSVCAYASEEALADPGEASASDEERFRAHDDAARAFFRVGAFDKAIEEFEKAYALRPKRQILFNLARACEENNEKARSVEYFKRYLAAKGDMDESRLAEARARMVALERAIAAEAVAESDFGKHKRTGTAFFRVGAYDKAIAEFEKAYALAPESGLLFNMARASEEAGDKRSAISYLQRFLGGEDSHDKRAEAEARLVALERELKNETEAMQVQERAAIARAALHERAVALASEARGHLESGDVAAATASWRQAFAVVPKVEYLMAIAEAERGVGNLTASIADYESAISLDPNGVHSTDARAAIGEMRQELARQVVAYDPEAWLDGRSRWGLGIKTGPILTRIDADFDGMARPSSVFGYSAETSLSRAVTRFVTLEAGLLVSDKRYVLDAPNAPVTTVVTLEVPVRVKFTTLEPSSGLVANLYGGLSLGTKLFGGTTQGEGSSDFDYMVEFLMDQQDPYTVYGASGGVEFGIRALRGEVLVDLRAELHSSPAFVQTSDAVGQGFFPRNSAVFRALLGYYYRGS